MLLVGIVLLICMVFITFLYIEKQSHAIASKHQSRGWSVGFYLRWLSWRFILWRHTHRRPPRLNNYSDDMTDQLYNGMQPTPEECALELPVSELSDTDEDAVVVWGTDASGRVVYARVARLSLNRASVMLIVKDVDGTLYTIPNEPDSTVNYVENGSWKGAGLWLQCVQPMRTWRVKFNGYLRKRVKSSVCKAETAEKEEDSSLVVEARLDLLWKALRAPIDLFREADPKLLAVALANGPDAQVQHVTSPDRDAYDQPGVLSGTVALDSSTVLTGAAEDMGEQSYWYLRGGRQRRWGLTASAAALDRSVELLSYFSSGVSMSHFSFSYPETLNHCNVGYIKSLAGDCEQISQTSFHLEDALENEDIPSEVLFSCSAGEGEQESQVHFILNSDSVRYYSGAPSSHSVDVVFGDAEFGNNKGVALAILTRSCSEECPIRSKGITESLFLDPPATDEGHGRSTLVVTLSDATARSVGVAGGKGSSLAHLNSLDPKHCPEIVHVPGGVVIGTAAWRAQVSSSPEVSAALSNIRASLRAGDEAALRESCDRAVEALQQCPVCAEVKDAIMTEMRLLYPNLDHSLRFAVRSSASDEDSEDASSAGQNLTVLGCQGIVSILAAVPKCWSSLVSYTSVQYKRQRSLDIIGEMAVIVQEMVDAEVAGVIFTRHPTSGSPALITINANYGLGESVVSGSSEPDTVTVRRSWDDCLTLQSCVVGGKRLKHVLVEGAGFTGDVDVSEDERQLCCITEELALRLAAVAVHVEKAFHSPRDIEFAVAKNKIYLLQARPITNLESWSELELLSELNVASHSDFELYTRANVGEVLPLPASPLALSISQSSMDNMIARANFEKVVKIDYSCARFIVANYLYVCLNVFEAFLRMPSPKVSATTISADLALFGHVVTTEDLLKRALKRHGSPKGMVLVRMLGVLIQRLWTNGKTMARAQAKYEHYNINVDDATCPLDLYKEVGSRIIDLHESCMVHIKMSMASNFGLIMSMGVLTAGKDDVSTEVVADMSKMLSACCAAQHSAGIPGAIDRLARVISEDEEAEEFVSMTPEEGSEWLRSHLGEVGSEFQRFIEQHGHRGIQELDVSVPSWHTDCRSLVQSLQVMVGSGVLQTAKRDVKGRPADVEEILNSLSIPLSNTAKRVLRFVLPLARVGVVRREAAKSCVVKVYSAFKLAVRKIGELLVAEGRLPEADLVYYLLYHELGQLLKERTPVLIEKAKKRRTLRQKMEKIKLPEMIDGRYNAFADMKEDELPASNSEGLIRVSGTAACIGKAVGPARVIHSVKETHTIKSGEILVTYSTDVGWTPYFPMLGGVVTEIGGLVSHGAVVAREYGLPCLVGATGATKVICTGDMVELDASKGIITKLEKTESS